MAKNTAQKLCVKILSKQKKGKRELDLSVEEKDWLMYVFLLHMSSSILSLLWLVPLENIKILNRLLT